MNDYDTLQHLPAADESITARFTIGNKFVEAYDDGSMVVKQRDIHNPDVIHTMHFMVDDFKSIAEEV